MRALRDEPVHRGLYLLVCAGAVVALVSIAALEWFTLNGGIVAQYAQALDLSEEAVRAQGDFSCCDVFFISIDAWQVSGTIGLVANLALIAACVVVLVVSARGFVQGRAVAPTMLFIGGLVIIAVLVRMTVEPEGIDFEYSRVSLEPGIWIALGGALVMWVALAFAASPQIEEPPLDS